MLLDGSLMDEVLQLMLEVARFDPSDAEAQVVLGVLQNVTRDLEAAVGAFQTALQRNPQDFSLLNKVSPPPDPAHPPFPLFYSYAAVPCTHYRDSSCLTNHHTSYCITFFHGQIGATLANGENSAEAIQYYAKALKIRPLYARGWLNLGIEYANLSQYDEAVKAYVQALAISPDAS